MKKEEYKIHIIGAGISGLIAASVLEKKGFKPTILESSDNVGGRVKTDFIKGISMDRGFQVLLSDYPMAKKYLDYPKLELQKLCPGAVVFYEGKKNTIGDPLRDLSFLLSTVFSSVGSLLDKEKILRLNLMLKNKTIDKIFEDEETSTLEYLEKFGFSNKIINRFFKPFFSGIFLETELKTSSRMFEFIYKMFGEGHAMIPKNGIQAIPQQLLDKLSSTKIIYNTEVNSIKEEEILLKNGESLKSDYTIIATNTDCLLEKPIGDKTKWKSCETLYFQTKNKVIEKPLIGLISDPDALINNIFYHSSIETKIKSENELLSVTVIKQHNLIENELLQRVKEELNTYCGIKDCVFIHKYTIAKALPDLKNIKYEIEASQTKLRSGVFLAGDSRLEWIIKRCNGFGRKSGFRRYK